MALLPTYNVLVESLAKAIIVQGGKIWSKKKVEVMTNNFPKLCADGEEGGRSRWGVEAALHLVESWGLNKVD